MKTINKWLAAGVSITVLSLLFVACTKENSGNSSTAIPAGKSQLSIYMMDAPVPFVKVLIDIKQVAVKIDTAAHVDDADDSSHEWNEDYRGCKNGNSAIWDTLKITPGIYDLIKLRNGTDTLLASGVIPTGKILKLRITLGARDTVYTDSVTAFPLHVIAPGNTSNTFDLNIRREHVSAVSSNQFKIWFDFNLSRSIFYFNGAYWLRPAFAPFNDMKSPKLQGTVLPAGASPLVEVFNTTDTLYALPWPQNGYYQIRGVNAGTYSVFFKGHGGYKDTTINNIVVNATGTTTVPTVTLHK
jgi:hypothetical protein